MDQKTKSDSGCLVREASVLEVIDVLFFMFTCKTSLLIILIFFMTIIMEQWHCDPMEDDRKGIKCETGG